LRLPGGATAGAWTGGVAEAGAATGAWPPEQGSLSLQVPSLLSLVVGSVFHDVGLLLLRVPQS